jgi:hypothetical protein
MRKLRLGSQTAHKVITDCLEDLGIKSNDEDMPRRRVMGILNDVISDLFQLSGWRDTEEYSDIINIPIIRQVFSNAAVGGNYDATSLRLTLPLLGDIVWTNSTGFDSYWLGAQIILTDTSSGLDYSMTIETVEDSNNVILSTLHLAPPDIAEADLIVNGTTANNNSINEADIFDLTQLSVYKQLYKIKRITSDAVIGGRVLTPEPGKEEKFAKDFDGRLISDNFADSIMAYRNGEELRQGKGANVSRYGNRVLYVVLSPAKCLLETDLVDVNDMNMQNVKKFVKVVISSALPPEKIKRAVSPEDISAWNELQASKAGKAEVKAEK